MYKKVKLLKKIPQPWNQFPDINHLLHHLRGCNLAKLPRGINRLLSAGCAGTWYFEWIEKMYGSVEHHTGVEFYTPKPADLPKNINWIANTVGHMPDVPDMSADTIISGQNLEHLWPEEVIGFFLESYRILENNGLLQIDSPNRNITSELNWSHPEHTVELTVKETKNLCVLAGFDITKCVGIWLCKTPCTNQLLPFDQMTRLGKMSMKKRMRLGNLHPEKSFIWWIEARKSRRLPQVEKLQAAMGDIFSNAWPERCQRMQTLIGTIDGKWFKSNGSTGMLMYGPYMPLRKGSYKVTLHLRCDPSHIKPNVNIGKCDVMTGMSSEPLTNVDIVNPILDEKGHFKVSLSFNLSSTTFGIQFRLIALSRLPLSVCKDMDIQEVDSPHSDMCISFDERAVK